MTYFLPAPNRIALVLIGVMASLEHELPALKPGTLVRSVQAAHGVAINLLPGLSAPAGTVARAAVAAATGSEGQVGQFGDEA